MPDPVTNEPAGAAPQPLNEGWLASLNIAAGEVADAVEALPPLPGDPAEEAAALRQAIRLIDLTTLAADDTEGRVRGLCARAHLRQTAAVCVYTTFVPTARAALTGSGVRICTVSAGFPSGAGTLEERVAEVRGARAAGADEIDVVIRRDLARAGAWCELHGELAAFRAACGPKTMKVILGTGELPDLTTIARAALVAMMAGADFVKTSTGKEAINATLPAGYAMARAIQVFAERTGIRVGLKPAGGISQPAQAWAWLALVGATLGAEAIHPGRLRFGASSLLDNLEARLDALAARG